MMLGKMDMPGPVSVDTSIWRVDRENRINFINKAWMDFAIANGAADLPARVLDTDLMDHIVGDDVKRLVSVLMERVRSTQGAAVLPFRCDGPDFRRHMELVIIPIENNGLEFRENIITTYDRHPPYTPAIPARICSRAAGAIASYAINSGLKSTMQSKNTTYWQESNCRPYLTLFVRIATGPTSEIPTATKA
jgi:hypothetical protein